MEINTVEIQTTGTEEEVKKFQEEIIKIANELGIVPTEVKIGPIKTVEQFGEIVKK